MSSAARFVPVGWREGERRSSFRKGLVPGDESELCKSSCRRTTRREAQMVEDGGGREVRPKHNGNITRG